MPMASAISPDITPTESEMRDLLFSQMTDEWLAAYEAGVFTEFMEQRSPGHTVLDDKIYGKGGDDTLVGGTGDDIVNGGTGTDTAVIAAPSTVTVTAILVPSSSESSNRWAPSSSHPTGWRTGWCRCRRSPPG